MQLVGDDNFVTSPALIARSADGGIANAALIKLNQIGTVTETTRGHPGLPRPRLPADDLHRSAETSDDFIADLAVGVGYGQIKSGAPARGERVAKFNRLMVIAAEHPDLPYGVPEPATTVHT